MLEEETVDLLAEVMGVGVTRPKGLFATAVGLAGSTVLSAYDGAQNTEEQ